MRSTLECITCFVGHAVHMAAMTTEDHDLRLAIVKTALERIAQVDMDRPPPEMARDIHRIIRDTTKIEDPYLAEKDESTRFALKILPLLRDEIAISERPFETMVRFVIAGNIIDFGADRDFKIETTHRRLTETLSLPLDAKALESLRGSLERAKSILYILDNCGEAVIDRLLIEPYRNKTIIGVRGYPILNDITRRELRDSGLGDLGAAVVDTGDSTPGVSPKHSSREFLDTMEHADLIIAKGQGNYETLSDTDKPIFFLLRTKCPVVGEAVKTPMGSLNIIGKNLGKMNIPHIN